MNAAFCPRCGTPRLPEARFCGSCALDYAAGAPAARRRNLAPLAALIAVVVIVAVAAVVVVPRLGGASPSGPATTVQPSAGASGAPASSQPVAKLSTPEDAVRAYMAGIAAGDMNAVLAASAIDEPAKGFDFQAYAEAMTLIDPTVAAPGKYPFLAATNAGQNALQICTSAEMLVYDLIGSQRVRQQPVSAPAPDQLRTFVASINPANLAGLRLLSIGTPAEIAADPAAFQARMGRNAALLGASDVAERLALFSIGGREHYIRFDLLQYGGGWKVWQQRGGDQSSDTPTPTTAAAFAALVASASTERGALPVPAVSAPLAVSGSGFASPDDAVKALLAAVASNDTSALLATTSVDPFAAHYDFATYAGYFGILSLGTPPPRDYPFFATGLRVNQEAQMLSSVRFFAYSLLTSEPMADTNGISGLTAERIRSLVQAVDPARLSGLTVERIGTPAQLTAQPLSPEYAAAMGADEVTERVALVTLAGRSYWEGFTLLRYGNTWWVQTMRASRARGGQFGAATPTTAAEFAALVGG